MTKKRPYALLVWDESSQYFLKSDIGRYASHFLPPLPLNFKVGRRWAREATHFRDKSSQYLYHNFAQPWDGGERGRADHTCMISCIPNSGHKLCAVGLLRTFVFLLCGSACLDIHFTRDKITTTTTPVSKTSVTTAILDAIEISLPCIEANQVKRICASDFV